MKKIIMIILITAAVVTKVSAQYAKNPVTVSDAPTLFNTVYNPYYDYAEQGSRMYENNSQFYNKDNTITNSLPAGNGQYVQPGNSNPINENMYQDTPSPSGTIYSGYIPVRDYGNATQSRDFMR